MKSEQRAMEDRHEHEELKRIAPTLFSMEQRDPFVVPDGFFERFPHEVQAAIAAREKGGGWAGLPVLVRRLAIALPVIALLAGAWWHFSRNIHRSAIAELSTTPSLDDLSWLDEQDLLASLDDADLDAFGSADLELSEAELAAYLLHENVDITELITEP